MSESKKFIELGKAIGEGIESGIAMSSTPKPRPPKKVLEDIKLPAAKPTPKQQFVRPAHLTQRPFNSKPLHTLRDGLTKSVKIKKK